MISTCKYIVKSLQLSGITIPHIGCIQFQLRGILLELTRVHTQICAKSKLPIHRKNLSNHAYISEGFKVWLSFTGDSHSDVKVGLFWSNVIRSSYIPVRRQYASVNIDGIVFRPLFLTLRLIILTLIHITHECIVKFMKGAFWFYYITGIIFKPMWQILGKIYLQVSG